MDSFEDDQESSDDLISFEDLTPNTSISTAGVDGTVDRVLKRGPKRPVTAIFVHAGAGYHSVQNEQIHLQACSEYVPRTIICDWKQQETDDYSASRVALHMLKKGCTAVEAAEIAVRVLEDKEITNAGFGSNLTSHGTVECDAAIVDHLGRSGACGAVPSECSLPSSSHTKLMFS